MIKEIHLDSCVPYQQESLTECKKINFIFGANGSGKSTISTFLSEGTSSIRFNTSELVWDTHMHEHVYVYDKAFRIHNLQQTIPEVFTLGSDTIEDISEVDRLKEDLQKREDALQDLQKNLSIKTEERETLQSEFGEVAWEQILKKNEKDFRKAFEGVLSSKKRFQSVLLEKVSLLEQHGTPCGREELIDRAQALYSKKPEICQKLLIDIDPILENIEKIRTDQIWSTIIAGNKDVDISALIKELNNSAWVSQGRQFLSVGSNVCPFCQKETITDMFRDKLESFFDTEYERRVDKVKNLSSQYSSYANEIVKVFNEIIQNTYSVKIGGLNTELYQSKVDLLKSAYQGHEERITNKISEPGMKIDIPSVRVQVDEIVLLLENANTRIETHNSLVAQHDVEEKKLTNDVWARCIYEAATIIKRYQKEMQKIEKAIDGLTKSYKLKKQEADKLREEIIEKEKNITSVQPTINDINCILQAYGFTNFSIQAAEGEENRYCIKRDDGTVAVDTLSEGEETFLTFLYFMQVVKGAFEREHISDKKIVVLDDPVSSLDSNVLYVVSTMIKELANNIRDGEGDVNQLFVLTHNAFFHKEVSFIDGRTKRRQDTNYWIIRKNKGISTIQPYGMENPISTSYELLWKEIRENTGITPISIQNTMRRIIENYFGILGSRRDDFLIEKFDTKEDKLICRSLLSWINDGSHSITDDISIDTYGDTVSRYKEVFRKLFEKSGHLPHYNMMMGISDAKSHEC